MCCGWPHKPCPINLSCFRIFFLYPQYNPIMKLLPAFFLSVLTVFAADGPKQAIEKLDPALDALIAGDAKIMVVADGSKWFVGPVWYPIYNKILYYSDVPEGNTRFVGWDPDHKGSSVFLDHSGVSKPSLLPGSNGMAVDLEGNLFLCQHGDRCVAQLPLSRSKESRGKFKKLATNFEGRRFNSPNDLCVAKDGAIYFTDPPYGLGDETAELDFHGIFKLSPDGSVSLVSKEVKWPNGIALSLDQKTLYIGISDPNDTRIAACDLNGSHMRDIFKASTLKRPDRPGNCDGLKLDEKGNIWATGPGGVLILSPEGKHLGTIITGAPAANLAWGGDGHTLFFSTSDGLRRIQTKVKGAGF